MVKPGPYSIRLAISGAKFYLRRSTEEKIICLNTSIILADGRILPRCFERYFDKLDNEKHTRRQTSDTYPKLGRILLTTKKTRRNNGCLSNVLIKNDQTEKTTCVQIKVLAAALKCKCFRCPTSVSLKWVKAWGFAPPCHRRSNSRHENTDMPHMLMISLSRIYILSALKSFIDRG